MRNYNSSDVPKTKRIPALVEHLYAKMPEIESARAVLITESYKETEGEPMIIRRAKAFAHILKHIPIIIRPDELIVGSTTLAPRGCQTYPEFSFSWLEDEFETVETRAADPFYISEKTKEDLRKVHTYWKGKTTSELAENYMSEETKKAIAHNMFTVGNYFYNGVGHVTVKYQMILEKGYQGVIEDAKRELELCQPGDMDYATKSRFLQGVIISCEAAILYSKRYAKLAREMAEETADTRRRKELLQIAQNCEQVPERGARSFYEACQSFLVCTTVDSN